MGGLDQAFIRAYHKDAAGPEQPKKPRPRRPLKTPASVVGEELPAAYGVDAGPSSSGDRPADVLSAPGDSAGKLAEPSTRPSAEKHFVDDPQVAAAEREGATLAEAEASRTPAAAEPAATSALRESRERLTTSPLSVYLGEAADTVADRIPLRPLQTVRRFAWPETCAAVTAAADGQLQSLVDAVLGSARGGRQCVLVTGCCRSEGRTTIALTFGRMAAASGQRIAIVDGDFARPGVATALRLTPEVGWEDVLDQSCSVDTAIIASETESVCVLPLVGKRTETRSLADCPAAADTLRGLSWRHDLILVDMGPIETTGDAAGLAALAKLAPIQGAIVLHRAAATSPAIRDAALDELEQAGIAPLGVVENFVPL